MATPAGALHDALARLLESSDIPPGYAGLRELYGSNAAIADAAGLPTAARARAAYREAHPRARAATVNRVGARARLDRQSFLRRLQTYARGSQPSGRLAELLESLRSEALAERVDRSTLTGLARLIEQEGCIVRAFRAWVRVPSTKKRRRVDDYRLRRFPSDWLIEPDDFEDGFPAAVAAEDWDEAARIFFDAWAHSYDVDNMLVEDVDEFDLEV